MKILLYGSTPITAAVEAVLPDVVGHVPSNNPVFKGKMTSKVLTENEGIVADYDILLSVQYDALVKRSLRGYNLHTGLLPQYGGCDILSHTLINQEKEQGLTFHKMSTQFDRGPIISKITYPVCQGDTVAQLYSRMLVLAPQFVLASLALLPKVEQWKMPWFVPALYKRGEVDEEKYKEGYQQIYDLLQSNSLLG